MNKSLQFLIAFFLMLTICGCVKDDEAPLEQENLHKVVFHAGWAPETKTVLQSDGSVWWSPGDEIIVFSGEGQVENGYKFTSTNSSPSAIVDFAGSMPDYSDKTITAIYPYDEKFSCYIGNEQQQLNFIVPAVQYATPGTFSKSQLISVARLENETFYFYNVCGGIKFSVANEGINKVVFTSRSPYGGFTYPISGESYAFLSQDGISSVGEGSGQVSSDGSSNITVYPSEGKSFIPGKFYYVAMIPGKLPYLEISFFKDDSFATYLCSSSPIIGDWDAEIKRANVKRLIEKDKNLDFASVEHTYARMSGWDMWPDEIDRQIATEINFHSSCQNLEGNVIRSSVGHDGYYPVYVKQTGTVIDFYTKAEYYMIDDCLWFSEAKRLKTLDLSMIDTRYLTDMHSMFMNCESLESVNLSNFNTSNVTDMTYMFYNCPSLEHLDLSSFNMAKVSSIFRMFSLCMNLKTINLCNAMPGNLKNEANAGALFEFCKRLTKVDLGNLDLSSANCEGAMLRFAKCSNNCAILCTPETRERLCRGDTRFVFDDDMISWYVPGEILPAVVEPRIKPGLYYSSDFSMDKKTKILNKATEGAGVDIVLLGDAYSDRLISDGTYENDMRAAMECLFSVEPMKSYRHLFNVYMVYAVSVNEIDGEDTAFDCYWDDYYRMEGSEAAIDLTDINSITLSKYSNLVIPEDNPKHLTRLVIVHDTAPSIGGWTTGGWAFMHPLCDKDDEVAHNCPTGVDGVAVIYGYQEDNRFKQVVCHEFGHAFAALYEEYVDRVGSMPADNYTTDNVKYLQDMYYQHGWWSNVDFTSDPLTIKWHRFLEDSRYNESEVSIIEGARYSSNIWRSCLSGIMGNESDADKYSVPAREAIYKVINKLAYGDSWEYDYETFVQQDLKNLQQSSPSPAKNIPYPARINRKTFFKRVESISADGKKTVKVIMN